MAGSMAGSVAGLVTGLASHILTPILGRVQKKDSGLYPGQSGERFVWPDFLHILHAFAHFKGRDRFACFHFLDIRPQRVFILHAPQSESSDRFSMSMGVKEAL